MPQTILTLSDYNGGNTTLPQEITQFNHAFHLLNSPQTNDNVRRRVINHVEALLISIITKVTDCFATNYDKRWLVANRQEINEAFSLFNEIRDTLNRSRETEHSVNVERAFHDLEEQYSNIGTLVSGASIVVYAAAKGAVYGGTAAAASTVITGASAFSFFGGPVVGGIVTGGTGLLTFGVATPAVATYGAITGASEGRAVIEDTIRQQLRP